MAKSLTFPDSHLSLIWPPTAIVLAALLLAPPRMWWMYLVALTPVHFFTQLQGDMPPWAVMSTLVGNFSQALLSATTVLYFNGGPLRFDIFRSIVVFTLCAVFLAPIVVSSLAAYLYVLSGWESDYWYVWRARILSNALSTLAIVPTIIGAARGITHAQNLRLRYFGEAAIIGGGLVIAGVAHLWIKTPAAFLLYAPLPWLLWAAVRFGVGGLSTSLLMAAFFIFTGTSSGQGPFASQSPAENVLSLQVFLITISLPLMFLAALIGERHDKEEALRESEARYRALVMASAELESADVIHSLNPPRRLLASTTPSLPRPQQCHRRCSIILRSGGSRLSIASLSSVCIFIKRIREELCKKVPKYEASG
jgi:integral membrane sensor domain MASE1